MLCNTNTCALLSASGAFKVAFFKYFPSLDEGAVDFVRTFALSRLEDAAMVVESLALLSFITEERLPLSQPQLVQVCNRVLDAVKRSRFGIESRLAVFAFVRRQIQRLDTAKDLYEPFLNAAADEKDPRILIQIFETVPYIAGSLDEENDINELFESVACYFPITFRATPADPRLISVESLKATLAKTLSCASFAPETMLFVLAKLASASNAAKLDSLELLFLALSSFPLSAFEAKAYELKIALFSEIVGNSEPRIQQAALKLLKALCAILPLSCEFHQKFLNEALSAVQLVNQEIITKAAVMIEAVSSGNRESFELAIDLLLQPLIQLARSDDSFKAQVSRNCLVALLSPLKSNPDWIQPSLSIIGPSLLADLSIAPSDYGVFLVIYSFVSAAIESAIAQDFLSRCLEKLAGLTDLPRDLKNCLWLASRSQSQAFVPFIPRLSNPDVLSSLASTAEVAKLIVGRLLELNHRAAIESVIENSELSCICADSDLVLKICGMNPSEASFIKLISSCSARVQSCCFGAGLPVSLLAIACEPSVLEAKLPRLQESMAHLSPDAICSLSNKLYPKPLFGFTDISAKLAAIRGRLWVCDSAAIEDLCVLSQVAEPALLATLESCKAPEFTSSSSTHHIRKPLWAQRFLTKWFDVCRRCTAEDQIQACLAVLFSVLSVAPQVAATLPQDQFFHFLILFLSRSGRDRIPVEARLSSWDLFGECFKSFPSLAAHLPTIVDLCLVSCSQSAEESCMIRVKALQILSKLVEEPQTRIQCRPFQARVCLEVKKRALGDPKRVVRREAARCRNLWLVLDEEGIFE